MSQIIINVKNGEIIVVNNIKMITRKDLNTPGVILSQDKDDHRLYHGHGWGERSCKENIFVIKDDITGIEFGDRKNLHLKHVCMFKDVLYIFEIGRQVNYCVAVMIETVKPGSLVKLFEGNEDVIFEHDWSEFQNRREAADYNFNFITIMRKKDGPQSYYIGTRIREIEYDTGTLYEKYMPHIISNTMLWGNKMMKTSNKLVDGI